ncbi:MAG: (p)ppGpp synthetase SpoT/RelA [Candidatus Nomurabacteria bacterium]|nr:(p)ppGpp synthetase SpoT/RelA [Candidatus Nomurabacteria bacterium]
MMNREEISRFVDEVNSSTPCIKKEDYDRLFELINLILLFFEKFFSDKVEKVKLAIRLSAEWHKGQRRANDVTPYIIHPLEVAEFFVLWRFLIYEVLIIAVLHDTTEDEDNPRKRTVIRKTIKRHFGRFIAAAVEALSKHRHPALKARYFFRMMEIERLLLRAIVIIVKTVDRIVNARSFDELREPGQKEKKIKETREIFPALIKVLRETLEKLYKKNRDGRLHPVLASKLQTTLAEIMRRY